MAGDSSTVKGRAGSVEESREVLRSKYLDYCSAQVADLLLFLSPDEIYLLAQRAHREEGGSGQLSYGGMVRMATAWLADKITLPPFDIWVEDYRKHPERYEKYLMGFWEQQAEKPDRLEEGVEPSGA